MPVSKSKNSISFITLGLTVVLACYNYTLHIITFHRCSFAENDVVELQRQTRRQKKVINENDGLTWITDKPNKARRVGYEDDWLMAWKDRHYSTNLGPRCVVYSDGNYTPYDDDLMCTIPGYIPARMLVPPEDDGRTRNNPPLRSPAGMISRVIFVSWFDRRLGKGTFTSLMTLMHHNPEYEFVFFDDEDVDRFLCETSREEWAIPILSRINAGAMRADIWRLLVIQRSDAYDDPSVAISTATDPTFCDADAFELRANRRERLFMSDEK
ncbi:hypothetical protein ACHAW5_008116 [Stephanodiscus triporus]|uniref:Glycosyltransferase family 92 protein n=1 Tax=Stephanodiscus triporus TaxID=2934178 RepID=A0ABD3P679_9STRA